MNEGHRRQGTGAAACTLPDGRYGVVGDIRMTLDSPVEIEMRLRAGARATLRCGAVAPDFVVVLQDGIPVTEAVLVPDRVAAVTLPSGHVTLSAFTKGLGTVERDLVVEPGATHEILFDGGWR